MAQSSKFARLDEDILLEFIYHDQNVNSVDDAKIENDDNGSQLKYLDTVDGDTSASRFLIHELGADVVNFTVTVANGFVYINNFASRELVLKNGLTYKFDLSDSSINNPSGFVITNGNYQLIGTTLIYTPNTNGTYQYSYTNLASVEFKGGYIKVGDRANSLWAQSTVNTGNTINTAPGEGGRYYAVPTSTDSVWALLDNSLNYLDSSEWSGTDSVGLTVVPTATVQHVYYDTIRLHLKTGYSFSARGYDGFHFQVKVKRSNGTYGYFTSIVYLNSSSYEIQNPKPFVLADSSFSKYIEIKVPSMVHMTDVTKNEEFATSFFDLNPVNSSANYEIVLSKIQAVKEVSGLEYIELTDERKMTLAQEDEFADLTVNIVEAGDGDYFEIWGEKDGSQDGFERYITERMQESGDDLIVFYDLDISEQLGLNYVSTYQTTMVQVDQFDQKMLYRPIIKNAGFCSSFLIRVAMRIYNQTDNTQILKIASIIYAQPKKYGKKMQKITLKSNDAATIIYNKLPNTQVNRELNGFVNSIRPSIGETKYVPVALDTYGVVAGSTNITLQGASAEANSEIQYASEGNCEITLSKVSDNFMKFSIARPKGDNLESISLVNAEDIILIIKSGNIEQSIHHNPTFPDVDLGKGQVFFKVPKSVAVRFDQADTNQFEDKFYINLKNGQTESLLYHGKVKIV
jgi:hypothetical protein